MTPPTGADRNGPSKPDTLPRWRRWGSRLTTVPGLILVAVVLAILLKSFVVQAFYIPSASMENTLQGGKPDGGGSSHAHPYDRVLVNRLIYDFRAPRRGEVVVFKGPPEWLRHLFVMGDHRGNSSDSRINGTVPVADVIGRVEAVVWPIRDWARLPVPATFHQPGLSASRLTRPR